MENASKMNLITLVSTLHTLTSEERDEIIRQIARNISIGDGIPMTIKRYAETVLAVHNANKECTSAEKSLSEAKALQEAALKELRSILKDASQNAVEFRVLSQNLIDEAF